MTKLTLSDIRALDPCYDPARYLPEDWTGTVEDILLTEEAPAKDRTWVALRLVSRDIVDVFAIDCALAAYPAYDAYATTAAAAAYADAAYDDAAYGVAYATTTAYAAYAAYGVAERERQIDALLWLIKEEE